MPRTQVFDGNSFLPQLQGQRGRPRDWIFWHYDPRPGHDKEPYTLVRFARTKRHKLYEDGRLFDVEADVLEQRPLPPGAAVEARQLLSGVLARHKP